MESILVGYDDPRLGAYFEHCTDEALKGQYRGIRPRDMFAHELLFRIVEAVCPAKHRCASDDCFPSGFWHCRSRFARVDR